MSDMDRSTQRFISDVKFSCPLCEKINSQEVEVPEPNFAIAEKTADLTAEGEVDLYCEGCGEYFEGDVQIGPHSCDITLRDYEDTMVNCDPPLYEQLIDEFEISGHPKKTFDLNADELRDIINTHASEFGGSTINRMIFTQILTILEAYLCDNLIKGLRDNSPSLVSFSKRDGEISKKKISVSDVLSDSNFVKKLIEKDLKNRIYHRFDDKKGVPSWYKAAFGFSLSDDPDDIIRLRDFVSKRHDCVHRNGDEKGGKKHEHFHKPYLLEALMTAQSVVEYINYNMNSLEEKGD